MPVIPEDRPLDTLRADTVDQLIMNYGHGHLSLDAFQRRLDQAYDAADHATLADLTRDLDMEVDPGYVRQKREELTVRYVPDERADEVDYVVDVLSGGERSGEWTVPGEVRVFNLMAGTKIDLTHAQFTSRVTRIRVVCLLGGVDIFVPEGVRASVKAFNLLGGLSNKAPDTLDPDAPRIIVEGLVFMGGVDIKVRKTMKERMREFADSLRTMLGPSSPGS